MTGRTTIGPVQILGAAFFSTHHASVEDALAGRERPFTPPAYPLLKGRARRFTSLVTQMHIEVCGAVSPDPADPQMAVFATCHGEIQTAERLIADFHETSIVSSARFALSVHNTASGVYSVATGSRAATTTVTGTNAIAAGWLEASLAVQKTERSVLLSIADEPVPAVFCGPVAPVGVAAAFLLGAASRAGRRVELAIAPAPGDPALDPLQVLARGAQAAKRPEGATVALGWIQPGAVLELRFPSSEASA